MSFKNAVHYGIAAHQRLLQQMSCLGAIPSGKSCQVDDSISVQGESLLVGEKRSHSRTC